MHFTNLVIIETIVICMINFSLHIAVHAGYPAEQFNELNNKYQRNLGRSKKIFTSTSKGGKASKQHSDNENDGGESTEEGFMPLAADGEVTLLVRTTSKEGEEKACKKGRNGKAEIYMDKLHLLAINVPKQDVKATIDDLSKQSGIESVEIDQEMHTLPAFRENEDAETSSRRLRSGTRKLAETIPYGIEMVKAESMITKGQGMETSPRKICVVDTGYALGHPDLPNNPDHSVTGFSPYGDGELWNVDGNSHGTHCAGTIGAVNNDIGVVGVNPDPSKFSFHIGKGLTNSGSGSNAGVMSAVNSCVDAGAHVISMSLGGGGASSQDANTYKEIYEEKGVLIIAAAGNSGNSALSYPASYPHIMSVAAVDSNENRASFSQYNSQVEIAGPGVNVQSTIPNNNGYASYSGTSMATPHVAGVAALVWSYFPQCTNHQIRGALIKSARDKGASGCDSEYGHGIVDAEAAFDLLKNNGCEAGDSASGPSPGGCAQAAGPTSAPTPFECTGTTLTLDLLTDNYGGETSWDIKDADDEILHSGSGYNSGTEYTENWCKSLPGCATFTIHDSYGDGVCCGYGSGSYSLTYGGTVIKTGGEFASSESTEFGCTPQTPAPTPSPTPLPPVSAPTPPPVQCDGSNLTVKMLTDDYGSETTWIVKDVSNKDSEVIVSGGPYASNTEYTHEECIPSGCVTFTIIDSHGDGLCCGHGAGSYEVMVDGVAIKSGGQFGYTESTSIDCPAPTPLPTPLPTEAPTTSPPTPSPTPSPTSSPTAAPTPAGCHATCATDNNPWVAAPGMDSKCSRSTCSSCDECVALTCVQGCYELDAVATGKCAWSDCAGCTDCIDP